MNDFRLASVTYSFSFSVLLAVSIPAGFPLNKAYCLYSALFLLIDLLPPFITTDSNVCCVLGQRETQRTETDDENIRSN
ncbi:uncharacterized [Tachysurus ichikawai]